MSLQHRGPENAYFFAPTPGFFPGLANMDRLTGERLLALALTGAIMVRLFISGSVLNSVYSYSDFGGSIVEKIHPGSYLLFLLFPLFLPRQWCGPHARRVVFASAILTGAIIAVGVASVWRGGATSAGFLVDAILIAPVTCLSIVSLSRSHRRLLVITVLIGLTMNSAVVFAELALQRRVLPYALIEEIFRPAGLLGHPLLSGLSSAVAIPFFFAVFRLRLVRWSGALLMLATCLACGARAASAVGAATFLLSAIASGMHARPRGRFDPVELALTAVMLLLCFPLLLALFLHSPTADRLAGGLAGDESVMSRISVYEALHFLSPNEFLFGAAYSHAQMILLEGVKLLRVESPIVSSVLMFGAVNTVVLGLGYLLFFMGLFRSCGRLARIAIVAFVIVGLSNNTLTTKSPALLLIVVLVAATDEYARPGSRVGRRNRPYAVNSPTRAVRL
jgi:hypothetical protein